MDIYSFFGLTQKTDYIDLIQKLDNYVKDNGLKQNHMIYPDEHLKRMLKIEQPFRYSEINEILNRDHKNTCVYCNEFVSNKFTHNKSKKHLLNKQIYELKQIVKEKDIQLVSFDTLLKQRDNHITVLTELDKPCCIPWF
jgi:hypothetical protein|tara:strand:+ start:8 stop:424 length:417 start_codon:yes stop_codon:yes gene_type:complete